MRSTPTNGQQTSYDEKSETAKQQTKENQYENSEHTFQNGNSNAANRVDARLLLAFTGRESSQ
jgi:hypothetical protein